MTQARDIIDQALATTMHAMQTIVATTLGSTPGALAFSRNMFLNIPLVSDWQAIVARREQLVKTFIVQMRSNVSITMLWVRKF